MDRRNFLRSLVGGVAVTAAIRTWPFRVYSFPLGVRPFSSEPVFDQINAISMREFACIRCDDWMFNPTPFYQYLAKKIDRHMEEHFA